MQTPVYFVSLGPASELITPEGAGTPAVPFNLFIRYLRTRQGEGFRVPPISSGTGSPESAFALSSCPWASDRQSGPIRPTTVYEGGGWSCDGQKRLPSSYEGDVGFISVHIHYIQDRLKRCRTDFPTCCRGARLYCGCRALGGIHVVKTGRELVVLPGVVYRRELDGYLTSGVTVVIMKLSHAPGCYLPLYRSTMDIAIIISEQVGTAKGILFG